MLFSPRERLVDCRLQGDGYKNEKEPTIALERAISRESMSRSGATAIASNRPLRLRSGCPCFPQKRPHEEGVGMVRKDHPLGKRQRRQFPFHVRFRQPRVHPMERPPRVDYKGLLLHQDGVLGHVERGFERRGVSRIQVRDHHGDASHADGAEQRPRSGIVAPNDQAESGPGVSARPLGRVDVEADAAPTVGHRFCRPVGGHGRHRSVPEDRRVGRRLLRPRVIKVRPLGPRVLFVRRRDQLHVPGAVHETEREPVRGNGIVVDDSLLPLAVVGAVLRHPVQLPDVSFSRQNDVLEDVRAGEAFAARPSLVTQRHIVLPPLVRCVLQPFRVVYFD
mmetsp:Transcript_35013/g.59444  ORF Transcript_35013/g.59444 Transcript_35013/m.59444 type:complete len:335 (+) Transcript_35013:1-1005(+)